MSRLRLTPWVDWLLQAIVIVIWTMVGATGCRDATPGRVDLERLREADREPGQWMDIGRGPDGARFSPLRGVNDRNVTRVGFAWEYSARSHRGRVEHGMESSPVVVDGVLYASGPWGTVYAVDARTGRERWRYDPVVDGSYSRRACCGVVNRGLQVWKGRVYIGTLDGFLVALDAANGREVWRVDTFIDRSNRAYTITGPPQVAGDIVVIGNAGADFGVRGYITAFDAESGRQRWRFFTVPADPRLTPPENAAMQAALSTWDASSDWQSGLGGTVWGEMRFDPDLDLLYVGTGNGVPFPRWRRSPSGGDNLYLASILAIHPATGELAWHYQTAPGEMWDYTATANLVLAELSLGSRTRKVIMQAPKNGFFYVLDRETGEYLSGDPLVFTNWTLGLDQRGKPIPNPRAEYRVGPAVVFPSEVGAHNWQPMAYDPRAGVAYIPARQQGAIMVDDGPYHWKRGENNANMGALDLEWLSDPRNREHGLRADSVRAANPDIPTFDTEEMLVAFDVAARKVKWRVLLGDLETNGGGVLATAGNLIVQGTQTGHLRFYRSDSGVLLHDIDVGTAIIAGPIAYELDGEQYFAVSAGLKAVTSRTGTAAERYENYGRIIAFRLEGGSTPHPPGRVLLDPPPPTAPSPAPPRILARGRALFDLCAGCHWPPGESSNSGYPDLFRMNAGTHAAFDSIVLGGSLAPNGMAGFADLLTPADVRALHAYITQEQLRLSNRERQRK